MKLWFINNLFVEKEDKSDIIAELDNEFSKHNILTSAGDYQTADLVECILKASGLVDNDFAKYIADDLRDTRRDLLKEEEKIQETRTSVKFHDDEFKEMLSMVNNEIYSLKLKDNKLSLARMEVIRNKLETILNRG